jgi:integrase
VVLSEVGITLASVISGAGPSGCSWIEYERHEPEKTLLHLHESVLQRAVRSAVANFGISKKAGCHTVCHSFATHLLQSGTNMRTVQKLPGHSDIPKTMIYTHVAQSGPYDIRSPADRLRAGQLTSNPDSVDAEFE